MVASQFSEFALQKPFKNQVLLPMALLDALSVDHVELDFSDVFGPASTQIPSQLSCDFESSNFNEVVCDEPEVICSRSHSLVGPSTYVSQSLKLSKLTLHKTEDYEIVEEISGEALKELQGSSCGGDGLKKACIQDNDNCLSQTVGLEDFDILKVVGQGAFAKVYQVRKRGSSEIYAMKVMRKDKIMEKDHAEYMNAERDILTKVNHPFIVQLKYSFQTKYRLYLVLDFVNGGHLFFQLYRQGLFREDLARFYTAEIVSAVSHLHSIGIMHRDLKPENIILDAEGHV